MTPEEEVAIRARIKANYEQACASIEFNRSETELKISQARLRREQNLSRPSIFMHPYISRELADGRVYYIAAHDEVEATGDTPEIALDNFDRLWSQGERL